MGDKTLFTEFNNAISRVRYHDNDAISRVRYHDNDAISRARFRDDEKIRFTPLTAALVPTCLFRPYQMASFINTEVVMYHN